MRGNRLLIVPPVPVDRDALASRSLTDDLGRASRRLLAVAESGAARRPTRSNPFNIACRAGKIDANRITSSALRSALLGRSGAARAVERALGNRLLCLSRKLFDLASISRSHVRLLTGTQTGRQSLQTARQW